MKLPLDKLKAIELALSLENGEFELFGAFLREAAQGRWDLIVAAPWLKAGDRKSLEIVIDGMRQLLSSQEVVEFSRVVVLDKGNPFLEELLRAFSAEHSLTEVKNLELRGVLFRTAYIITAKGRLRGRRRYGSSRRVE
jgi:hypothetical protein